MKEGEKKKNVGCSIRAAGGVADYTSTNNSSFTLHILCYTHIFLL